MKFKIIWTALALLLVAITVASGIWAKTPVQGMAALAFDVLVSFLFVAILIAVDKRLKQSRC